MSTEMAWGRRIGQWLGQGLLWFLFFACVVGAMLALDRFTSHAQATAPTAEERYLESIDKSLKDIAKSMKSIQKSQRALCRNEVGGAGCGEL